MSGEAARAPHIGLSTQLLLGFALVLGLGAACQELDVSAVGVTQVEVEPTVATVFVGQTRRFTATPMDAQGRQLRDRSISWASDNPSVATVDGEGQLSALAPGAARIIASSEGRSGEATVTVMLRAIHTVEVTPASFTIGRGETRQLQSIAKAEDGSTINGRTAAWSSANPAIASVDGSGLVTGVAEGTTRITASIDGQGGDAVVTVLEPVATVEIAPGSASVPEGETTQLQVLVKAANGSALNGRAVTWSSEDSGIATVDANGLVTGVRDGTTRITATAEGKSGQSTITVTPTRTATIEMEPSSTTLIVGATLRIEATARTSAGDVVPDVTFAWASSNAAVATVNGEGVVTAVAVGESDITASAEGVTGSAKVFVADKPVATVELQPSGGSLFVGDSLPVAAVLKATDGTVLQNRVVSWATSDAAVGSVSPSGPTTTLKALGAGAVTVTATSEGRSASAQFAITPKPVAGVRIDPQSANLLVDGTVQLQAVLTAADGTTLAGRTVAWTSNNAGVATVTGNGLVRGIAAGTATVTATSEGQSGTATIEVGNKPVASVAIQPPADTLVVGDTVRLRPVLTAADNATLTGRTVAWATSDAQIAQVDQAGKVTGVAPGDATITATSEGKSGQAAIRVIRLPVASVEVEPATATVLAGATQAYEAVLKTATGAVISDRQVTWRSLTPAIATVAPGPGLGLTATATAVGAACTGQSCAVTIEATAEGVIGTATLTVRKAISTIELSPAAPTLAQGASVAIQATVKAADGTVLTGRTLSWSSSSSNLTVQAGAGTQSATAQAVAATCTGAVCTATVTASAEGKSGASTVTITKAVATIEVDPAAPTLYEDESQRVRAIVKASDGTELTSREVAWTTSSSSIAGVNGIGQLRLEANVQARSCPSGSGSCTATITASADGKSGTAQVTVRKRVANVEVQPASVTLPRGSTQSLKAVLTASDNTPLTDRAVTWSSSAAGIARAEGTGTYKLDATLTAVGLGNATITATAENVSGASSVTVVEPVATIEVSPSTVNLVEGASAQLQAIVKGASGAVLADRAVTWTSTNATSATATGTGTYRQDATLNAGSCPVGTGTCAVTIRATAEGVTGSTAVTVTKQVATVSITPNPPPDLFPGETVQLTATPLASDGTDLTGIGPVTWTSATPAAASVTGGLVTANNAACAVGAVACSVSISATIEGRTGSVTVNILKPVATVELTPDPPPDLYPDDTIQLVVKLTASDGTNLTGVRTVAWSSNNSGIARVADGLVTAVGTPCQQGAPVCVARITALANGVSADVDVRVLKPVARIEVNPALAIVRVEHTQAFGATLFAADGTVLSSRDVTWSWNGLLGAAIALSTTSGNSTVATGKVVGAVTLTASAEGKSGAATVTIIP